ncbi:unnamed protein product, partial [marine sediment metagenome]
WKPHASNPIKVDVRSARPAGNPFYHNGNFYRPSQDCSEIYGGKIVLNRITRLSPTEFKEEKVNVIGPYKNSPYPDGIHTISSVGDMTIIDGFQRKFIGLHLSFFIVKIKKFLNTFNDAIHKK